MRERAGFQSRLLTDLLCVSGNECLSCETEKALFFVSFLTHHLFNLQDTEKWPKKTEFSFFSVFFNLLQIASVFNVSHPA